MTDNELKAHLRKMLEHIDEDIQRLHVERAVIADQLADVEAGRGRPRWAPLGGRRG